MILSYKEWAGEVHRPFPPPWKRQGGRPHGQAASYLSSYSLGSVGHGGERVLIIQSVILYDGSRFKKHQKHQCHRWQGCHLGVNNHLNPNRMGPLWKHLVKEVSEGALLIRGGKWSKLIHSTVCNHPRARHVLLTENTQYVFKSLFSDVSCC